MNRDPDEALLVGNSIDKQGGGGGGGGGLGSKIDTVLKNIQNRWNGIPN